jgi:hypothetical protein
MTLFAKTDPGLAGSTLRPAWDAAPGVLLGAAPQKSQSSFSCFVVGTFPMHTVHL